jgi:hypothetical protein
MFGEVLLAQAKQFLDGARAQGLRVVTAVDFGPTIPNTGGNYAMVDTELPYVSTSVYFLCNVANQRHAA